MPVLSFCLLETGMPADKIFGDGECAPIVHEHNLRLVAPQPVSNELYPGLQAVPLVPISNKRKLQFPPLTEPVECWWVSDVSFQLPFIIVSSTSGETDEHDEADLDNNIVHPSTSVACFLQVHPC